MKKSLILFSFLLFCSLCSAQVTTVNATITDPSGQAWGFGNFAVDWQRPASNQGTIPNINGVPIVEHGLGGNLDNVAHFTINLADAALVLPSGGQWVFTICPFASSQCYVIPSDTQVTGGSVNLSAFLNAAINNPTVNTMNIPRAYKDSEIISPPKGGFYYDITLNCLKFYNGIVFACVGTGGGGGGGVTPGLVPQQAIYTSPTSIGGQDKPIYDVRDWMICDGVTDASSGMNLLLSTIGTQEATIHFRGTTNSTDSCRVGNTFFGQNITLDFSPGGSIQLISSTTPIGSGSYVNSTTVECGAGVNCSLPALNITNGNTIVVVEAPYPGFTFKTTKVIDDCGNFYIHVFQSLANQPRNQGAWIASSAHSGNCTITATANGSLTTHMMGAVQIAGMGPVTGLDTSASNNATGSTMSSGTATTLTGAFLLAFGGQPFTFPEVCTAGAGYTQPAGAAGQSSPNGSLCLEYNNTSAGGSTSATQTISINPSPSTWVYSLISLKPGNATATIWGSIYDPDKHKIFYNADSITGHGVVDFTGANLIQDVEPEWWGACGACTAAVNTPALQAAVWAAFGGGQTNRRTNASLLTIYNRPLHIGAMYQINDELQFYSVNGFKIYGDNRLGTGIQQTATNKRIIDGQSISYGSFSDMSFSTQSPQNAALVDLDWNGITTPGDLKPQFIDLDRVGFGGAGAGFIGLEIAKSGGSAQGSNIYCRNCSFQSFTEACVQIGTAAAFATNAVSVGFSGDMQGCTKYGIASYGGGYISFGDGVEESSMENATQGLGTQTGFDMICVGSQGPCSMDYMRSESRRLISGNDIVLHKSRMINQAQYLPPGQTFPVGSIMTGSTVGGDGAYYKVTSNAGPAGGVGTLVAPLHASSGTTTTLVDTNQTITGSVTIKGFGTVANEVITQAVTGATGVVLTAPASTGNIVGTWGGVGFTFGETITQAVTGVTCVETSYSGGNPAITFNCNNFSGTADNSHVWTGGTSGSTFTPSAIPVFTVSTLLTTAVVGAPDNTHDWVGATNGGHFTPTTTPVNQANFTVNAFTGMTVSTLAGKNAGCYGIITSNTATDITFTAGWITRYAKLQCPGPDTSSTFVVEWTPNHGTVTTGGMTMQYLNEFAIDCQNPIGTSNCNPSGRLEDVIIAGGQVKGGPQLTIDGLIVARQDWYDAAGAGFISGCCDFFNSWNNVRVIPTVGPTPVPYQGAYYQNWTLPSLGGVSYTGSNQERLFTKALVWDTGNININNPPANTSASSVWIGGRSDPGAGAVASRNILEFGGFFGRGAPLPSVANGFNLTNLNGTDTDITGGPSTGTGVGGCINFWTSNPSGSSALVNSALKRGSVCATGWQGPIVSTSIKATGSFATGSATNTDVAGELFFTGGVTSGTYNFTGTYSSAPDCTIGPNFDYGANRIWWSTRTIASIQLSSNVAQTGSVSYVCVARD